MPPINPRELLVFIDQHQKQTGRSPGFEEIKTKAGLLSTAGLYRLLSALEERGFIARRGKRMQSIEVLRLPADQM